MRARHSQPRATILLRPSEVAERTGISTSTLSKWRREGIGPLRPVVAEGRVIRYSVADVDRLGSKGVTR